MKTQFVLIILLSLFIAGSGLQAQWTNSGVNPFTMGDPEILNSAPDFLISHTLDGQSSVTFRKNTNEFAAALYRNASTGIGLSAGIVTGGVTYRPDLAIDEDGNVGLGTKTPVEKFEILNGNMRITSDVPAGIQLNIQNENTGVIRAAPEEFVTRAVGTHSLRLKSDSSRIIFEALDTVRMVVLRTGHVGIGTTAPTESLEVHGNMLLTGTINGVSDARLKNNIRPMSDARSIISRLNPVTYSYQTEKFKELDLPQDERMGLIAQEVEEIIPSLVNSTSMNNSSIEEIKTVNYVEMIPLLIRAIQELEEEIETLRQ